MVAKPSILTGTRIRTVQAISSKRISVLKMVRSGTFSKPRSNKVAKELVNNWTSSFGCPANLPSNTCFVLGTDRTSTTSNHPQGSAKIEKTNRTIERTLSKYVGENDKG